MLTWMLGWWDAACADDRIWLDRQLRRALPEYSDWVVARERGLITDPSAEIRAVLNRLLADLPPGQAAPLLVALADAEPIDRLQAEAILTRMVPAAAPEILARLASALDRESCYFG